MKILNLGILAHVDAGKTSLTERLLYAAGAIDAVGSVDAGNTQTDSLVLERQRGITIKSAVVSFVVNGTKINLIDTPGHPDFIAEVERVLHVLDGVVLVISAIEGVQAQTRVLMRVLKKLRIPTLIFVNKIDRNGARYEDLLVDISGKLDVQVKPMGSVRMRGSRSASFVLDDLSSKELVALAAQTKERSIHPVFFGSAKTGEGVEIVASGITNLLSTEESRPSAVVSGSIFKIERGPTGEKIAYVRMFDGILQSRRQVIFGHAKHAKITALHVFDNGTTAQRQQLTAGEIGQVWGLHEAQIGDTLGTAKPGEATHYFAPPTLETVVFPGHKADQGKLHAALKQLAEQDPLINLRQDDVHQEIYVSLYGEVQKEVIQDTLLNDFGITVRFRKTSTICVERPNRVGEAVEIIYDASNPFLATVGLRIEPAAHGSGVQYRLAQDVLGKMRPAFFKAIEDTVIETLQQGLRGWQVTDCKVTLIRVGYAPRQSHAHARFDKSMSSTGADFRGLTPLVLMEALKRASTTVCEPVHQFELEVPSNSLNTLLSALARLGAVARTTTLQASTYNVQGSVPAANIHTLQQELPELTSGEGTLSYNFEAYNHVRGSQPVRPRTDNNPLDRKEYLLRVLRHT